MSEEKRASRTIITGPIDVKVATSNLAPKSEHQHPDYFVGQKHGALQDPNVSVNRQVQQGLDTDRLRGRNIRTWADQTDATRR